MEDRIVLATLPGNFSEVAVATGLSSATAMEIAPDGKLFVAEQGGTMEVWLNGARRQANFFANAPISTDSVSERGLLGVTFDPNYATNRFVYVYYTTTAADRHNRVSRFTANGAGDLALAGSESVILELDAHSAGNHNGGAIHFGPDGKLYVAVGDNASGANSQSMTTRHGKMLRINPDGSIPTDNPFYNTATGANRAIWALGLRNPYTFSFRPGTGTMFINDVGQSTWEEINVGAAGANYGWPTTEGDFTQSSFPSFTRPFYAYSHGGGTLQGFAITGGAFYDPASPGIGRFPTSYNGDYFFADYINDWINVIDTGSKAATRFASGALGVVDLRVAADGSLYYLARDSGSAFRVAYTANQAPAITQQPANQVATQGGSATFTASASGSTPLAYRWQRAEAGTSSWADISGATAASYTLANVQASDDNDLFRVIVSNAFGSATSSAATLDVTTNLAPSATITTGAGLTNGKFIAGQAIAFSGTASDPEDGTLGASRFTWRVDYITSINSGNPVVRPFVPEFAGQTSGSFTPATTGPYTLTDVLYRVVLTVTDSANRSTIVTRDIAPNVATLTVTTSPSGLQVTVDGQPFTAPRTFAGVVGFQRPIGAAASQVLGGTTYNFASWSDAGAATHTISTPSTNTTYTASYTASPATPGLRAEFFDYTTGLSVLPNLSGQVPNVTRTDAVINYASTTSAWAGLGSGFADTFASRHTGYLRVDTAGSYTLYLNSDDGSKLWLDGVLLINNDGLHAMQERSATRTLTAGYHSLRVEFFENGGGAGLILSWAGPGISKRVIPASQFSQNTGRALQQDGGADGLVVVEAESYDGNVAQGGKSWVSYTAAASFSGSGALQANPNTGAFNDTGYVANSPRLDFRVNFVKTGIHYVWVRGRGASGSDDSIHVGLDGAAVATADRISSFPSSGYAWTRSTMDGAVATINVTTPGIHTINLWMREDGTVVDKLLLTTSSSYTPTGLGPAEGPRPAASQAVVALASGQASTRTESTTTSKSNTPPNASSSRPFALRPFRFGIGGLVALRSRRGITQ